MPAHCSHTPCHTCATSFTRERELGDALSNLAKGKKVMFLCSCAEHYNRPAKILGYEKTKFKEHIALKTENESNVFDFSMSRPLAPYPIVKLTYDDKAEAWSIDKRFLEVQRPAEESTASGCLGH